MRTNAQDLACPADNETMIIVSSPDPYQEIVLRNKREFARLASMVAADQTWGVQIGSVAELTAVLEHTGMDSKQVTQLKDGLADVWRPITAASAGCKDGRPFVNIQIPTINRQSVKLTSTERRSLIRSIQQAFTDAGVHFAFMGDEREIYPYAGTLHEHLLHQAEGRWVAETS